MLTKPTNWDSYLADSNHYYETVLRVGSTEYTQDDILSLTASQNLYGDEYSVGGTVMNEWDATLYNVTADAIPKFSKVEVWTRLCKDSTHYTDYIPKGVFYTKKPSYDTESKLLTISGYDEVFRTEQEPFATGSTVTTWVTPTLRQVVQHIVEGTDVTGTIVSNWSGIGVVLEDATQISNTMTISAVPYGYTVRQILADIAVACGGNWTMVFTGTYPTQVPKLRLVKVNTSQSFKGTVALGRNVQSFEVGDTILDVDETVINYGTDSNGAVLSKTHGTHDDGRIVELTVNCLPDATVAQTIADNLYTQYQNDTYIALTATGCELDPCVELGDTVTVNSKTSTIGTISTEFSKAMFADIESQGITESDDFPYLNASTSKLERDLKSVKASISVQAAKIGLVVEESQGTNVIKSASIVAAINDTGSEVLLDADKVKISGTTTFDSLFTEGTTTIDGGKITADTIQLQNILCEGDTVTIKDEDGVTRGSIGEGVGSTGSAATHGVKLANAAGDRYLILTNAGIALQDTSSGTCFVMTGNDIYYALNGGQITSLGDAVARFG